MQIEERQKVETRGVGYQRLGGRGVELGYSGYYIVTERVCTCMRSMQNITMMYENEWRQRDGCAYFGRGNFTPIPEYTLCSG